MQFAALALLLSLSASAAPIAGKVTLTCLLGDDSYNSIVLTPSDSSWPTGDSAQGSVAIDFGGYRFGGELLGSYRDNAPNALDFAVTFSGDATTLVSGTITGIATAKPVLRIKNGPYFISNKGKNIHCTKQ